LCPIGHVVVPPEKYPAVLCQISTRTKSIGKSVDQRKLCIQRWSENPSTIGKNGNPRKFLQKSAAKNRSVESPNTGFLQIRSAVDSNKKQENNVSQEVMSAIFMLAKTTTVKPTSPLQAQIPKPMENVLNLVKRIC
jgi:hypothetical protein